MTTVARRTIRSAPFRSGLATWEIIVDLLTAESSSDVKEELLSIGGVASSIIGDKAPSKAAILVTCDGPRTWIYCVYDEDAVDGSDANEDNFGFNPLGGDWQISLPCEPDDLKWVQEALAKKSKRVTARDKVEKTNDKTEASTADSSLKINVDEFMNS